MSSSKLSAFPLRSLRLCGEDWGAHIFEPQRRRERRGNAESFEEDTEGTEKSKFGHYSGEAGFSAGFRI